MLHYPADAALTQVKKQTTQRPVNQTTKLPSTREHWDQKSHEKQNRESYRQHERNLYALADPPQAAPSLAAPVVSASS